MSFRDLLQFEENHEKCFPLIFVTLINIIICTVYLIKIIRQVGHLQQRHRYANVVNVTHCSYNLVSAELIDINKHQTGEKIKTFFVSLFFFLLLFSSNEQISKAFFSVSSVVYIIIFQSFTFDTCDFVQNGAKTSKSPKALFPLFLFSFYRSRSFNIKFGTPCT